ncbi:CPBP family intramembrane glutamic endopeptidase [Methylacidiphilum caldifontis]|uniref:CAAX protease n=1 Tax=Methylacidiphilum caldifontis TaxID=2795386 RepID=A0A4Y8PGX7_9BACT|nr:CPBP family intramembrane glutamic endopeptidase [Methylacidiphilum caldifontis]QSR88511.1 CPBP family intramembrane metalloprotease [Methylacidiphilum caldifontis]TFE71337.1 CAAX protease [Methylacidiphilum caldifontis]
MFVLLILILFSFLLSAALSPISYFLLSPYFGHFSFLRLYHRLVEVLLLGSILIFRKKLGLFHWSDIGFKKPFFKALFYGIGLSILITVGSVAIEPAIFEKKPTFPCPTFVLPTEIIKILFKAASVAIIEEILMRGILLGVISRSTGDIPALFLSSALYSFSHFLNVQPNNFSDITPLPYSGFLLLQTMVKPFFDLEWFSIKGLVLFLLGLILGVVYIKDKNLWRAIGVHGGIVFFVHIQCWIDPERWLGDPKEALLLAFFCTILWIFWLNSSGRWQKERRVFLL